MTLPNGAHCSDDLAAAHYRLVHAVPMTLSDYHSLTFGSSSSLMTLPCAAIVRKQSQAHKSQVSSLHYQEIQETWSDTQDTSYLFRVRFLLDLPLTATYFPSRTQVGSPVFARGKKPFPASRPVPSNRRLSRWFRFCHLVKSSHHFVG